MAFDGDGIGELGKFSAHSCKDVFAKLARVGTAGLEEHALFFFEQLDAEAFSGDSHRDMILDQLEVGHLLHGGLDFLFKAFHVVFG